MAASWISPAGQLIDVGTNHIDVVIKNPTKFGYTISKIKEIYDKWDEKLGVEGNAREEIIINIIKSGWIRIRKYRNYWSATINTLNNKTKDLLYQWAKKIVKTPGENKYFDVQIVPLRGNQNIITQYDVQDISKDILLKEDDGSLCKLQEAKIEDLPDVSPKSFKELLL